ncbi:hypothetical protein GCM10028803_12350 [Larkinella knui]|uniref:T9SS C-terminal target domain-containing protein n=1 Tax=Larkinella knui TaxID=2025310 RepID=A0A3P1CCJ5_9BACT|nr:hypothetical protein [Larkinella knui]RRB10806.1 hypothetical protein EHT87_27040 [Larkinella knui]
MNTTLKASLMALGMGFIMICVVDAVTPQSLLKALVGQSGPKANVTVVVNRVDDQPITVRLSKLNGEVIASKQLGEGNTVHFGLKDAVNGTYRVEVSNATTKKVKDVVLSAQKAV